MAPSARAKDAPRGLLHMPHLDGLRAMAVGAVLLGHFTPRDSFLWRLYVVPWAPLGVQLFFVLSGFLITGILLDCRTRCHQGTQTVGYSFRQFYVRRFLRIFPVYYLTLAVAGWTFWPLIKVTFWWHALYASNVFHAAKGHWLGYASHLWSLSVEEQFYLLWPLVVLRVSRPRLPVVIGAVILAAPLYRAITLALDLNFFYRVVLLPAAMDALAMGALLALLGRSPGGSVWIRRVGRLGVAAALPAYVALAFLTHRGAAHPEILRISFRTLTGLTFFWVVHRAATGFGGPTGWFLGHPAVRYVGRISYGIYLFHHFVKHGVQLACDRLSIDLNGLGAMVVMIGVTVGLASASWHLYEAPLNGLKRRFPYEPAAGAPRPLEPPIVRP